MTKDEILKRLKLIVEEEESLSMFSLRIKNLIKEIETS